MLFASPAAALDAGHPLEARGARVASLDAAGIRARLGWGLVGVGIVLSATGFGIALHAAPSEASGVSAAVAASLVVSRTAVGLAMVLFGWGVLGIGRRVVDRDR